MHLWMRSWKQQLLALAINLFPGSRFTIELLNNSSWRTNENAVIRKLASNNSIGTNDASASDARPHKNTNALANPNPISYADRLSDQRTDFRMAVRTHRNGISMTIVTDKYMRRKKTVISNLHALDSRDMNAVPDVTILADNHFWSPVASTLPEGLQSAAIACSKALAPYNARKSTSIKWSSYQRSIFIKKLRDDQRVAGLYQLAHRIKIIEDIHLYVHRPN